jgi:hypothetical protein
MLTTRPPKPLVHTHTHTHIYIYIYIYTKQINVTEIYIYTSVTLGFHPVVYFASTYNVAIYVYLYICTLSNTVWYRIYMLLLRKENV